MTTADWAILISIGSLVVALFSFIWNVWSKFIYPKPRVRVDIGIMTLMPNPNDVPSFVSMNATNYGPTDVTLYAAIARKRRPWFRRHGPIAVLNPLEGFPDRREHLVGPFSGGLPKKLAVGEQFSVYLPVVKDWVEKENLIRFGFSDTFERHHWCTRRGGEEFRKQVSAREEKVSGTFS